MWRLWFLTMLALGFALPAFADRDIDSRAFATNATLSAEDVTASASTAIATLDPNPGAPGYAWLRIHFYGFAPDADDIAGAIKGDIRSMDRKWNALAANPAAYRSSFAVLQLTIDDHANVTQVDMSVPGHACTIAPFAPDVRKFLQAYRFDEQRLSLKSEGSYVCNMAFMGIPDQTFSWDIDLIDIPVFAKAN
ncbi:MAG TPA: hypothetical protein VFZ03_14140 [Dongiaceae bacterium]